MAQRAHPTVRLWIRAAIVIACAVASLVVGSAGEQAASGGSAGGFVVETVVPGLSRPTDFAFAPDGRIFIAQQDGVVRVLKDGALLPAPFITLTVNEAFHRGLLGLALDPDFQTNGYLYLYYTYENNPADPQGPKTGRLIRVTASGDVALPGSEVVLLGSVVGDPLNPSCNDAPAGSDCLPADGLTHIGGALRFAADGMLFLATGDASPFAADPDALMVRSQDLDSLAGKVLRIRPDGRAPPDNPFYTGDPAHSRSKVWAYGFRNAFRLALQPGSDLPFVGDVGSEYWEEINVATPGANFGWPCYEGGAQHPVQNALPLCQAMYASGTQVAHPLYSYPVPYVATVIVGLFYQGTGYPAEFQGTLVFGDWARGTISILNVDAANDLVPDSVQTLLSDVGNPVDFEAGPDGDIYYLSGASFTSNIGELRHLRFLPGNRPPIARGSAVPLGGHTPLTVQFSSAGSGDPDGQQLSFSWDFADGAPSNEPNPEHTFAQDGTYAVLLTVSDGDAGIASTTVTVIAGNSLPHANIVGPASHTAYVSGQTIAFSGYGTDEEDGVLPSSNSSWQVILHHCSPQTGSCHSHPFLEQSGGEGTLIAPAQGGDLLYVEPILTVRDSAGLTDSRSVIVGPDSDQDGLLDFEEVLILGTDRFDADSDADGIPDSAEDIDGDGCTDRREIRPNEHLGGRRNPNYFWDFYDVWTRPNMMSPWTRDKAVTVVGDLLAVAQRFGAVRPGGAPAKSVALTEALTPPTSNLGYHTGYDRGPLVGPNVWNSGPPDGGISIVVDVLQVARQWGHSCL